MIAKHLVMIAQYLLESSIEEKRVIVSLSSLLFVLWLLPRHVLTFTVKVEGHMA